MEISSPHALQTRIQPGAEPPPPVLLHVLPEEIYLAKCIPGSRNACVYETAFLDHVAKLGLSPEQEIVVYGAGAGSLDAQVAREKLEAAGYRNVVAYPGGLADWERAGLPLEGDGNLPANPIPHGRYVVDPNGSVIRWTGRNLFNAHYGTVRLASGELVLDQGALVSGRLAVDMNTIVCEDLAAPTWNEMLIRHLRDPDFFDVRHYPVAQFTASEVIRLPNATPGTPGHLLQGTITVRGVSQPLEVPVALAIADPEARRLSGQAQFELDRTAFGSIYGSGKFFRFLGKHLVNDHIHLHAKLHADRVEG